MLCDGSFPNGDPCQSKICFSCAGVTEVPAGDFHCGVCQGKRQKPDTASTPVRSKQSKVISPDIRQKIQNALHKDKLPLFPSGIGDATSSGDSSFGLIEAFGLITAKLDGLDTKLSHMVTMKQFDELKSDLLTEFEKKVGELKTDFANMQKENGVLRGRVDELERRLKSVSSGPDGAFRRISFIGFPLVDERERIKFINDWMSEHFSGLSYSVGNISKGPVRERKLTAISYVEFPDPDVRNFVLKKIKADNLSCKYKSSVILVKPALSQFIRDRIWAFNTAHNLITKHAAANGKTVEKRTDSNRAILVDGVIAFDQSSPTGLGNFLGAFSSLALPGKAVS